MIGYQVPRKIISQQPALVNQQNRHHSVMTPNFQTAHAHSSHQSHIRAERSFRPAFKYYYFQYITAQEKRRRALPWASNGRNKKIDSSDPQVFKRCFKSCNIKFQVPRNLITDTDNFQISDPSLTSPNGVLGELRITMI